MYINKNILYILKLSLYTEFVYELLIMFETGLFNSKSKFRFELGYLVNEQV